MPPASRAASAARRRSFAHTGSLHPSWGPQPVFTPNLLSLVVPAGCHHSIEEVLTKEYHHEQPRPALKMLSAKAEINASHKWL